jgi:hypothetical protein
MRGHVLNSLRVAAGGFSAAIGGHLVAGFVLPAEAHEVVPGVRGFASLLLHPFIAVETVLLMIGLALIVGAADGRPRLIAAIITLPLGALAGVALQPLLVSVPGLWRLPLGLAFILGAAAAAGRALRLPALIALMLLVALTIAFAVPPERPGLAGRLEVAAAVNAAILLVLLVVAMPRALLNHRHPARLAGQILGAWIVAISLLGIANSFR